MDGMGTAGAGRLPAREFSSSPSLKLLNDEAEQGIFLMTADEYLLGILAREAVDTSAMSPVRAVQQVLMPVLSGWAGQYLQSVSPSGSFAKGTANRSSTDIDLFVSLSPATENTLQEIYDTLFNALTASGYTPRRQNVSIGLRVGQIDVDLVPAKQQNLLSQDHSLYRQKARTWTKTNIQTHITHVLLHRRQMESRITKLWRTQNNLEFPSFYIELAVIEALRQSISPNLSGRVWEVLQYLANRFETARFVDPANTNNIISDDLTTTEKSAVRIAAQRSLQAKTWGEIIR